LERLRNSDLRGALDFLERVGAAADLDAFAEGLVSGLPAVIPADFHAYNEVDPALRRTCWVDEPRAEASLPDAPAILARHMHENPLVAYTARTGDGTAHTWSDFVGRRRLHATELWNGLFRPFGIEHQMVALLPAPPPLLVGVVLNRSGVDFSERERALLNLLRPHLAYAYRNAQARTIQAALERDPQGGRTALVLVGALGDPVATDGQAKELLAAFGPGEGGQVAERLRAWCREARERWPAPPAALMAVDANRTVEAQLLSRSVLALRVVRERLDPASLRSLGLTRREREVLVLVAEGRANKEIALELGARPATVKKHLERIYDRLGVHTRTAAAAAAIDAGRAGSAAP
jgi:DNA-binding CsgD family transcriptional regulator